MDEFGVLVESIGFKAQGKSAPMAKLKAKPKSLFGANTNFNTSPFSDASSLPVDELDGIFRSNVNISKNRQSQNFIGGDNIFGGSVSNSDHFGGIDLESVLINSNNNNRMNGGNLSSSNSLGSDGYDDLLGLKSEDRDPVDDLFGKSDGKMEKEESGFDELLPGFGGTSSSSKGVHSKENGHPFNSQSAVQDDPFLVFESAASHTKASWSIPAPPGHSTKSDPARSSIDDLEDIFKDRGQNGSKTDGMRTTRSSSGAGSNRFQSVDDLDALLGVGPQKHASRPANAQGAEFDIFVHEENRPEVKRTFSPPAQSTKKVSASTNIAHDFGSLFGDLTSSSGEFEEIEGEPEERRTARLKRHMRMNERMAEALAEKNQRDLQSQQEQDEKRRIAETLDYDIKRWAAGKEGNLRALLSSLQQVLWPECGWRPVSLTDMITSDSVKKVYKRATLSVHPDKVQQKGATIQQKYIAEKVFDLLKEAWNKFSAEELR